MIQFDRCTHTIINYYVNWINISVLSIVLNNSKLCKLPSNKFICGALYTAKITIRKVLLPNNQSVNQKTQLSYVKMFTTNPAIFRNIHYYMWTVEKIRDESHHKT